MIMHQNQNFQNWNNLHDINNNWNSSKNNWILRQKEGGEGEQDLTELRNMHAQMYAELPK